MQRVSLQKLGNIVTPNAAAIGSLSTSTAAAHGIDTTSFIGLVQPPNFTATLGAALPTADSYTWVTADSTQFTGLVPSTADHASCCRFG